MTPTPTVTPTVTPTPTNTSTITPTSNDFEFSTEAAALVTANHGSVANYLRLRNQGQI